MEDEDDEIDVSERLTEKGFPINKMREDVFSGDYIDYIYEQEGHAETLVSNIFDSWAYSRKIPTEKVLTDIDYKDFMKYAQKYFQRMLLAVFRDTVTYEKQREIEYEDEHRDEDEEDEEDED